MKIKFTSVSAISDKTNSSSSNSHIPTRDDELIVKVHELLSIIKAIFVNIRDTQGPTISEFSALTYILQTTINNINKLSSPCVKGLKLDQEWLGIDRLTAAHILNVKDYYEHNKAAIMSAIKPLFMEKNIYDLIENHLKQPHLAPLLRHVSVEGHITSLLNIESLLQIPGLPLPNNQLLRQREVSKDTLDYAIYYHIKLMHSVVTTHNTAGCYGIQAVIINIYHALGNLLKLKYNQMGGERWEGADFSLDYLLLRNLYAHAEELHAVNSQDLKTYFGKNWNMVLSDLANYFPQIKEINKQFTKLISIKSSADSGNKMSVKLEEAFSDILSIHKQQATKSTEKQQTSKEESLDEIIESLSGIVMAPSVRHLQTISYNISKQIIDIIKDAYNARRDLTSDEISQIKIQIDNPLFNPNKYIYCKYLANLENIKDVALNIAFKPNKLVETLVGETTKYPTITKKRPIDLLVEIANSAGVIEIVNSILAKGANPAIRDRELFSLIEHALKCEKAEVLKVILNHIQNIDSNLLLKVLDGNVRGTIEEGCKIIETNFVPLTLSLSLDGKEDHAIELARNDVDLRQRIVTIDITSQMHIELNIYGKALKCKAFKFIESLFDNPNFSDFRQFIYADHIGKERQLNTQEKMVHFFGNTTNLHHIYSPADYQDLLSVFIRKGVDLSQIPSLYKSSPKVAEQAIQLLNYDSANPESVINFAKIINVAIECSNLNIVNTIIGNKISSLTELMSTVKDIQKISEIPHFKYLYSFFIQVFASPKQIEILMPILISNKYYDLATDIAMHYNKSPESCIRVLKHFTQVQNPHLKQKVIDYFKEHKDNLSAISPVELIKLLPSCIELINEIAETILKSGSINAIGYSALAKRIEKMDDNTKSNFVIHVKTTANQAGNSLEKQVCHRLLNEGLEERALTISNAEHSQTSSASDSHSSNKVNALGESTPLDYDHLGYWGVD